MNEDEPSNEPILTSAQLALISNLSVEELEEIDSALLESVRNRWQKVAMIVGRTMMNLTSRVSGIPDIFYRDRLIKLVEEGILISQGNIKHMRNSEVKFP